MADELARGRVPFVGLTGGIGSGKSEALAAFGRLGAATLSSDLVVHELLASDELSGMIEDRLGADIAAGGFVDRDRLGAIVFEDDDQREWLEGVLWPRVAAHIASWRERLVAGGRSPRLAIVEVPLLFESEMEEIFDFTVVVVADEALSAARATARGHTAVGLRAERQLGQREKAQRADYVVVNDGDLADLERQLSRLVETIAA